MKTLHSQVDEIIRFASRDPQGDVLARVFFTGIAQDAELLGRRARLQTHVDAQRPDVERIREELRQRQIREQMRQVARRRRQAAKPQPAIILVHQKRSAL